MLDKLPCELTTGVTATREGLYLSPSWSGIIEMYCATDEDESWVIPDSAIVTAEGNALWPWPDAAARLLITEEVQISSLVSDGVIYCSGRMVPSLAKKVRALRRIATILCDGVDDHELLYWCVTNLGGEG